MIWTLGDFNSVYLLTGGGPADLTHVLATLGIRYLRLDQVDLSMAAIVVRAAAGAAARLLHDEAAVEMSDSHVETPCASRQAEAKLLLIGIPVLHLDPAADLPHVPVRDLAEGGGVLGQALARPPDAAQFRHRVPAEALLPRPLLAAALELARDRASRPALLTLLVATAAAFAISRLKVQGRPHGDEPRAASPTSSRRRSSPCRCTGPWASTACSTATGR